MLLHAQMPKLSCWHAVHGWAGHVNVLFLLLLLLPALLLPLPLLLLLVRLADTAAHTCGCWSVKQVNTIHFDAGNLHKCTVHNAHATAGLIPH